MPAGVYKFVPFTDGKAFVNSLKSDEEKVVMESFTQVKASKASDSAIQVPEQNGVLCIAPFLMNGSAITFGGLTVQELAVSIRWQLETKKLYSQHIYLLSGNADHYQNQVAGDFAHHLANELGQIVHAFADQYAAEGSSHYLEVVTSSKPRDGETEAQLGDLLVYKVDKQRSEQIVKLKAEALVANKDDLEAYEGRLLHKFHEVRIWGKRTRLGPVPVLDFLNFEENTFYPKEPVSERERRIENNPSFKDRQERAQVVTAIQKQIQSLDESTYQNHVNWLTGLMIDLKRLVTKTWREVCDDYLVKMKGKKPFINGFKYFENRVHLSFEPGQQPQAMPVNPVESRSDLLPGLKLAIGGLKAKLEEEIDVLDARRDKFCLSFLAWPRNFERETKQMKFNCLEKLMQAQSIADLQDLAQGYLDMKSSRVHQGFVNTVDWAMGVSRTTELLKMILKDPQALCDAYLGQAPGVQPH